jgi:hypothetical protein
LLFKGSKILEKNRNDSQEQGQAGRGEDEYRVHKATVYESSYGT